MGQECSKNCRCSCAPIPSATDKYMLLHRIGCCHILVESVMCFILFVYFLNAPAFGLPALITSIMSLIGASVAICCCQTYAGVWWNEVLFSFASFGRFIIIISMIATRLGTKEGGGIYVLYLICMLLGSASGILMWEYGRRAIKSLIDEGRTDPDIIYQNHTLGQNAIAQSTVASYSNQPVPASAVVLPSNQINLQPNVTYTTSQSVPQYAIQAMQPGAQYGAQYPQFIVVHGQVANDSSNPLSTNAVVNK